MSMERILAEIRSFDGLLELAPQPGSHHSEISWGDHFFYYAPDGIVPRTRQPYATIVTKNYPDDGLSRLNAPDRWRLNINVGSRRFAEPIGHAPGAGNVEAPDFATVDVFTPHPLYGPYGWVSVVNPAESTTGVALESLREAHLADRRRVERRNRRDLDDPHRQARLAQPRAGDA